MLNKKQDNMRDQAQIISHSIDAIERYSQVKPSFKYIQLFAERYKDEMGVNLIAQQLYNQLANIEL